MPSVIVTGSCLIGVIQWPVTPLGTMSDGSKLLQWSPSIVIVSGHVSAPESGTVALPLSADTSMLIVGAGSVTLLLRIQGDQVLDGMAASIRMRFSMAASRVRSLIRRRSSFVSPSRMSSII